MYRELSVLADLPPGSQEGKKPYEMVLSGRKESPKAQVGFDDLHGWTIRVKGEGNVSLAASKEQLLFRDRLAKFTYDGKDTSALIVPPRPIVLKRPFDAVNLWVCGGNLWDNRTKDKKTPQVVAHFRDSAGRDIDITLGSLGSTTWDLRHGILKPVDKIAAKFPMTFHSLEISNWDVQEERSIYLESLAFYMQRRKHELRKRPSDAVFPTSDDGMLPTPPPDTSVRVERVAGGADFICEASDGRLVYRVRPYEGLLHGITAQWEAGRVLRPMDGGGIRLDIADAGRALSDEFGKSRTQAETNTGAGITVNARSDGMVMEPSLGQVVDTRVEDNRLRACWRLERENRTVEWQAIYALKGRTLIVDVECKGSVTDGLDLGSLSGLSDPRHFLVPYFVLTRTSMIVEGPWWGCGDGLFVSVLPDLYHSDFSTINAKPSPEKEGAIGLIGGTKYVTLTNGKRRALRDRILVTVSPEFEETLPNARNPVSPNREKLAPYFYFMSYDANPELYRTMKRYGIDKIIGTMFCYLHSAHLGDPDGYNDPIWNFSARWHPRPPFTLEDMRAYGKTIRDLGYLFGGYFYTITLHTYNEFFDENDVALAPTGEWAAAEDSQISLKMEATIDITRRVGEKIREFYPTDFSYVDIGTCIDAHVRDYEAEDPNAAIARLLMFAHGDSLIEARKWFNAISCEGYARWFYAGLSDIDYASMLHAVPVSTEAEYFGVDSKTLPARADVPPFVDFDLLKIHPFAHGTMMGFDPTMFLNREDISILFAGSAVRQENKWVPMQEVSEIDRGNGLAPLAFYKWLAGSIAYGHMGALGYHYIPQLSRCIHLYSMMQGIQKEYLTDNAAEIRYHDGKGYVSTSQALLENTLDNGRVRVRYSRGLTVYANCNPRTNWVIEEGGAKYELPPYGWLAIKPGEILSFSALVNGHRLDYLRCPEYTYMNSCGTQAEQGTLDIDGAVLIKWEKEGMRLIPCGDLGSWEEFTPAGFPKNLFDSRLADIPSDRGCSRIVLNTRELLRKTAQELEIWGRDDTGNHVPAHTRILDDGRLVILPSVDVVDYLIK